LWYLYFSIIPIIPGKSILILLIRKIMKQKLLFAVFSLLTLFNLHAQTINVHVSGFITSQSNGNGVENHQVIIRGDSAGTFPFYAVRYTGLHGEYDCTIQGVPANSPQIFSVSTLDCHQITLQDTFLSTNSPATVNFVICTETSQCQASYETTHDSLTPFLYHFISTSTAAAGGTIAAYDWDFGDNTTHVTTQDPWHTFAESGFYTVCLTITTTTGCTSTYCTSVHVIATGCEARYEFSRDPANAMHLHFFDVSYLCAGNSLVSREWDFGDGSAHAYTQDPWHTYASPGEYVVCLSIVTSNGCTSTFCKVIYAGTDGCQANFEYAPDSANLNRIHFFDTSTVPSGVTVTGRSWNFGDGTTLTGNMDPWHEYASPGNYQVCLSIETSNNCSSTKCKEVHIQNASTGCESTISYVKNMLTVHFEGHTQSNYPTDWHWNFGDLSTTSDTSSSRTPVYMYPAAGQYVVRLETHDAMGCVFVREIVIHVQSGFEIWGHVHADSMPVDHGTVKLIRMDSANAMTVADIWEFGQSGSEYSFGNVQPGEYLLLAELAPSSVWYGQFAPTYYMEALFWTNAMTISTSNLQNPYNFSLRHITAGLPGNGQISGTVSQGNKVNMSGNPAAGVSVLLLNLQNQPLGYAITDSAGKFSFEGLAMGTYTVWPEVAGLTTTAAHYTLSSENPSASVAFRLSDQAITFGINNQLPDYFSRVGELYPNPVASGAAKLDAEVSANLSIRLLVLDPAGKILSNTPCELSKGRNILNIPAENLRPGLYIVQLMSVNGSVSRKLMVK
jgi:PKD repeat protein